MSGQVEALQARVEGLETLVTLMRRHPIMLAEALGVSPMQARIVTALREAAPRRLLSAEIEAALYHGAKSVSYHLIHVHVSQLRKRLNAIGIEIECKRGNTNPGWSFSTETVLALDAYLERHFAGAFGSAA